MEFDNDRVDVGGVDDRRGGGGASRGVALGGGGGVVALIITVIIVLLNNGGGGGSDALNQIIQGGQVTGGQPSETASQLSARCNSDGALDKYTDCRLIKVYDVVNTTWSDEFDRRGMTYRAPHLAFFDGSTATGCGQASAEVGPFYCPADERIYLDLGFLQQLEQQFGIKGQFAEAYIVAHEAGHHLQKLQGIEPKVRAAAAAKSQAGQRFVGPAGAAGRLLCRRLEQARGRGDERQRNRADVGGRRRGAQRRGCRRG